MEFSLNNSSDSSTPVVNRSCNERIQTEIDTLFPTDRSWKKTRSQNVFIPFENEETVKAIEERLIKQEEKRRQEQLLELEKINSKTNDRKSHQKSKKPAKKGLYFGKSLVQSQIISADIEQMEVDREEQSNRIQADQHIIMRPGNQVQERIDNNNNIELSQSQQDGIKFESRIWQMIKKYMPIGLTIFGVYGTIWLIRRNQKA